MKNYRSFVFTASGPETYLERFSGIDLYDNLIVEVDRLDAMAALLGGSREGLETETLAGVALLLGDVGRRMREILKAAEKKPERKIASRRLGK